MLVMANAKCALLGSGGVGGLGITTGRNVSPQADQKKIEPRNVIRARLRNGVVSIRELVERVTRNFDL